jgi:hypothetical protein
MLRRVALVRTGVSGELSSSFIRVTRISELGTTLAVTNNRCEEIPSILRRHVTYTISSKYTFVCVFERESQEVCRQMVSHETYHFM